MLTHPSSCYGASYTTAITYTYDPADADYVHNISGCRYNGGVTFTSSTAGGPLLGVRVLMTDSAATYINFTAAMNTSTGSSIILRNVVATSTVTMGASFFGGSTGHLEDSTLTGQLTINSAIQHGSHFTINATTINSTAPYACHLSLAALQFNSTLRFLNSTLTTTGNYAMYLAGTNISDGSRLVFEDTTLNATNALYMSGYQLNSGGVLYMRRTTMMAASAPYYTMYVQGSGGQIDHDGSNRHSTGGILIMFNEPSSGNLFVPNRPNAPVRATDMLLLSATSTLLSLNRAVVE